jgi:uncharacterized protein
MLSAFYEVLTGRAPDMLRAYVLAVLVQMVAVNLLVHHGYLNATVQPFFGLATAMGGVVFGLGMVLAMGCAGAVLYRAGEGKADYLLVMLSYVVAAWASNNWLVQPVRLFLRSEGAALTLYNTLSLDRWLIIAIVGMALTVWLVLGKRQPYHGGWDWSRTGITLGLLGVVAWLASALGGKPSGLGTVHGSDGLATLFFERDLSTLDWSLFVVLGIPMGSFIAARRSGQSPGKPFRTRRIPQTLVGGLLMGIGATLVEGDNVLHGLTGVPLLAVSSITFMACSFVGVWAGVRFGWLR